MTQIVRISQNPVIATDVQVTLQAHPQVSWVDEDGGAKEKKKEKKQSPISTKSHDIGNVTSEADFTFQFSIKPAEDSKNKLPAVPFQAQIRYTRLDGYKCIRIITKTAKVSNDREEVEKNLDVAVVALNGVQQAAKIALNGGEEEFEKARDQLVSVQRLLSRAAKASDVQSEGKN